MSFTMINVINRTVCYRQMLLRVSPKCSSQGKIGIFPIYFVSIWDGGCLLNLL